jgi:hypothetical protein
MFRRVDSPHVRWREFFILVKKIKQDWSLLFCDEHGWDEKIESVAHMEQKFGRHASKLRTYLREMHYQPCMNDEALKLMPSLFEPSFTL